MNWVALSALVGVCYDSLRMDARGGATSMGPNGWNPNPTLKGLCSVELCMARL
jgi:hypothetical protein